MIILRNNTISEVPYNQENITKYKSPNNMLRHARYVKDKTTGIILVDEKDTLLGYIAWEDDFIVALEVIREYRRNGIATDLLEKAVSEGATKLSVRKTNTVAFDLYKRLGFKVYSETPRMYFMEIDKK